LAAVAIQKLAPGLRLLDWFGAKAPRNDEKAVEIYGGWYNWLECHTFYCDGFRAGRRQERGAGGAQF
jgi:hypothetical protein